jgi:integrase/recombinase XerD
LASRPPRRWIAIRARRSSTHPKADLPWLWLGPKGQLTDSGIRQLLDECARSAGLGHLHPHQFRHTFAARLKQQQAPHEVVKRLGGWQIDAMVNRYGAKDADDRARAAYPQYSPMDRLRHR